MSSTHTALAEAPDAPWLRRPDPYCDLLRRQRAEQEFTRHLLTEAFGALPGLLALAQSVALDPRAGFAQVAFVARHISLCADDLANSGRLSVAAATHRAAQLLSDRARTEPDARLTGTDH